MSETNQPTQELTLEERREALYQRLRAKGYDMEKVEQLALNLRVTFTSVLEKEIYKNF